MVAAGDVLQMLHLMLAAAYAVCVALVFKAAMLKTEAQQGAVRSPTLLYM
jgi:hypothetical protein